jgi:hypothetical protein
MARREILVVAVGAGGALGAPVGVERIALTGLRCGMGRGRTDRRSRYPVLLILADAANRTSESRYCLAATWARNGGVWPRGRACSLMELAHPRAKEMVGGLPAPG